MALIKSLITPGSYKSEAIAQLLTADKPVIRSQYDDVLDTLMVKVPPKGRHMVYYLHGDIAFLLEPDTLQIVGFWIENFTSRFLAQHQNLQPHWEKWQTETNLDVRGQLSMAFVASALQDAAEGLRNESDRLQAELTDRKADLENSSMADLIAMFG